MRLFLSSWWLKRLIKDARKLLKPEARLEAPAARHLLIQTLCD